MTPETADRWAVRLAASGIAAGAIASRHIGQLCGFENTIGFDMGGTSTDISLVYEGEARTTTEWSVQYGYPIRFPSIEVLTIGAGGGSLAWIDDAGSLRNGPQSAGADPGPALLRPGWNRAHQHRREPRPRPARRRAHRRRHDPRPGQGRGGAAHAARRAARAGGDRGGGVRDRRREREHGRRDSPDLRAPRLRPARVRAGLLRRRRPASRRRARPRARHPDRAGSAEPGDHLGARLPAGRHPPRLLHPPARHVDDIDAAQVEREFAKLEEQAMERMRVEGVAPDKVDLQRTIDMRYAGQWRSIAVPVEGEVMSLEDLARTFEDEHDREHSYRREGSPIEVYRLNLRAVGATQKAELARHERQGSMPDPDRSPARALRWRRCRGDLDLPPRRPARRRQLRGPRRARAARLHGAGPTGVPGGG